MERDPLPQKAHNIEHTVTVQAPPEAVFKALTDAAELVKWFPTTAESDPRPGVRFKYTWEFLDEPEKNHSMEGEYSEFIPNHKVSYPWHVSTGDEHTFVEFTTEGTSAETKVTLVHSGWGSGQELDTVFKAYDDGWRFFMSNLKSWLERNEDERSAKSGQKTRQ